MITEEGWFLHREEIEEHDECIERAKRVVQALRARAVKGDFDKEKYIVVVTHAMFISTLFSYMHGVYSSPRYHKRIIRLVNSSISMAVFPESKTAAVGLPFLNVAPHLD